MENKIDELQKRIRENSLVISRVPKDTKEKFIAIANEAFAGDYGLLLKDILDQALEYQAMKGVFFENINMKLDNILESISQPEQIEQPNAGIKTLSGRTIGTNRSEK